MHFNEDNFTQHVTSFGRLTPSSPVNIDAGINVGSVIFSIVPKFDVMHVRQAVVLIRINIKGNLRIFGCQIYISTQLVFPLVISFRALLSRLPYCLNVIL